MGLVCVSCQRKLVDGDLQSNSLNKYSTFIDTDAKFHRFIEEKRSIFKEKGGSATLKLNKVSKFDEVILSASNYWENRHQMELSAEHRPIILYRIKEINNLIRVNNTIVTRKV